MASAMEWVEINARYQGVLERWDLRTASDFFNLPGVIVSGHPDRHVMRVELGEAPNTIRAFLKREHRVAWKDRLLNSFAGFGPISKSHREARTLQAVQPAGIVCPEWIAAGEDDGGRSFVLVREMTGAVEARHFLERPTTDPKVKRRFVLRLGQALARLHNAGFDNPDLCAKHVFVRDDGGGIGFVDWQRSRLWKFVPWGERYRELAALHATSREELISNRDRLHCLRAYLRSCRAGRAVRVESLLRCVFQILQWEKRLLRRRRVREMRHIRGNAEAQNLVWLDGEALCVTPQFLERVGGKVPDRLVLDSMPQQPRRILEQYELALPGGGYGVLTRRRTVHRFMGWWCRLRGTRPTSPEVREAGVLFRSQRLGIRAPRLLAFGQRQVRGGRIESFLLTEPSSDAASPEPCVR
jgi:hypothetical protein